MEIGISTASFFSRMLTEESLAYIGAHGVPLAETFLDTRSEYTEDFAHILRENSLRYDVKVVAVHAMAQQYEPQLFSIGQRQRQDAWRTFEDVLRVAKIVGADRYVFHGPANMLGTLKYANFARIGPIANDLAELAGSYGVKLCWENVSWAMYNHPGFGEKLLQHCASENLYFTLDVKQAMRSGYEPLEYLRDMGSRLAHVHLCDLRRDQNGKLRGLALPGEGDYDFARLARALGEIHYQGVAMVEVYSDLYQEREEVLASRNQMQTVMNLQGG